ncbi:MULTISPECIES: ABC transporter permease [unclassified Microbacterium]|uniref:ABC transporter permease n=1 Tax=unclassified Microbacterium TaxID=2609290 RepID=UPI00301990DB
MSTEALLSVRRRRVPTAQLVRYVSVFVGILAIWWLISLAYQQRGGVVPAPLAVFGRLFSDGWAFYQPNLLSTLGEAAQGYLWGNLIALALGAITAVLPAIRPFLSQVALFAYSVPIVAVGPILVTAFPGRTPMIILSATAVLFLTLSSVADGLGMSDRNVLAIVESRGGTPWQRLRFVRAWFALPSLFSALKMAVPAALLGAIFGEYLGRVDSGLGVVLVRAQKELQIPRAWGIILVMIVVSCVGYFVVALIGRRVLRWAKDFQPGLGLPDPRLWVNVFGIVGSAVLLTGIWWAGLKIAGINPSIGKTPVDVVQYLFAGPGAAAARAAIARDLAITLGDMTGGFVVGMVLAIVCALLAARAGWFADLFVPSAIILRATPLVAIAPLMFIAIGRDYVAVTTLVGIVVFFPAFLVILEGMRVTPRALREIVEAFGGGRAASAWYVTLPASIPYIFSALRITLPNALMGALIAEWLATGRGLGATLISSISRFEFGALWAGVVVATVVSVLLYTVVDIADVLYRRARHLT